MLDKYIILNRKPNIIISMFIYILILFVVLVIYLSNIMTYTSYYFVNSYITLIDNDYYLKMNIPIDKLNLITKQDIIFLDGYKYNYQVYKISDNIESNNCLIVYLEVYNLDNSYKFNNYVTKVMLKEREDKIINYLKEVNYD